MFTPSTHAYVGTTRAFIPQGYSPYDPTFGLGAGTLVLPAGDTVDVLSAWTRDYLPGGGIPLLYVRSHATGLCTHVVAADLPL